MKYDEEGQQFVSLSEILAASLIEGEKLDVQK